MKKRLRELLITIFCIHVGLVGFAQTNKVNTLVEEGVKLYEADKIEKAVIKYKEALALEPNNPRANCELAFAYVALAKLDDAIEYAENVIKPQNKYSSDAGVILGYAYNEKKQYHKAMNYLETALYLNPKSQRGHYQIAFAHHHLTNDFTAENHIVHAIRLDPGHKPSYSLYGDISKRNQRPGTAALLYCLFLMMEPNSDRSPAVLAELKKTLRSREPMEWGIGPEVSKKSMEGFAAKAGQKLNSADSLAIELQAVFSVIARPTSPLRKLNSIFTSYYGPFFYDLANSDHIEVVTHMISVTDNPDGYKTWLSANQARHEAYYKWLDGLKKYKLQ